MGRIVIDNSRCKSCYICTMTCPKGLIKKSDKTNRLGDYMVEFDDKNGECIGCAIDVYKRQDKDYRLEMAMLNSYYRLSVPEDLTAYYHVTDVINKVDEQSSDDIFASDLLINRDARGCRCV